MQNLETIKTAILTQVKGNVRSIEIQVEIVKEFGEFKLASNYSSFSQQMPANVEEFVKEYKGCWNEEEMEEIVSMYEEGEEFEVVSEEDGYYNVKLLSGNEININKDFCRGIREELFYEEITINI